MSEYADEISKIRLLTESETYDLIIAMKKGDIQARQKLIKHNLRAVLKVANKYKTTIKLPLEDLISIGSFALIKAVDNYDFERDIPLSSVIFKYLENAYNTHIHLSKMQLRDDRRDISLQQPIYEDSDGGFTTLEDIIQNDTPMEEEIYNSMRDEKLREILDCLRDDEKEILFLRNGFDNHRIYTLKEIGKRQNLTKERIRQKEAIALKKLRAPNVANQIKDFVMN